MTTEYSTPSSARRAAKTAGLSEFDIYKSRGGYKIRTAARKAAVKAAKRPKATSAPKAAKVAKTGKRKAAKPASKATKVNQLIELITQGATITELTEALGWQRHTVRAALSRLGQAGHVIERRKVGTAEDGFESSYKIAA